MVLMGIQPDCKTQRRETLAPSLTVVTLVLIKSSHDDIPNEEN